MSPVAEFADYQRRREQNPTARKPVRGNKNRDRRLTVIRAIERTLPAPPGGSDGAA